MLAPLVGDPGERAVIIPHLRRIIMAIDPDPRLPGSPEGAAMGLPRQPDGRCFPSYEAIAAKAECCQDTVYEALKVLELAGVLTWTHRITRIQVRERDLFGKRASRWRVIRTSNAYVFHDPQQRPEGLQDFQYLPAASVDPDSPLKRALRQLGASIEGRLLLNGSGGQVPAT